LYVLVVIRIPFRKTVHVRRLFFILIVGIPFTVLQVASSTTPEEVEEEDDADSAPIVPMSPIPAPIPTVSKGRRTSRGTRLRMRANVQGLDEEDSDGDIEIVDFADGELL
jgi:hypothetical protein